MGRTRSIAAWAWTPGAICSLLAAATHIAYADPAVIGEWRLLAADTEVIAIHAALLPSGRILILAGSGNDHNYRNGVNQARLFDPTTEATIGVPDFAGALIPPNDPPTLNDNDIFCAGHSFLPDGRLLVAGGNLEYPTGWVHRDPGVIEDLEHGPGFDHPLPYDNPEVTRPACHGFLGLRETFLFDADTESWSRGPKMARGRWYPSTLPLAGGTVLIMGGFDDVGAPDCRPAFNATVQTFDGGLQRWSAEKLYPASWPPALYPYLHLLPNGRVFYAGPTADTRVFDPDTLADIGPTITSQRGCRDYGSSVLLPLLPEENYRARVFNAGGVNCSIPLSRIALGDAELIDFSQPSPTWQLTSPMPAPRVMGWSTLLPDGTILVTGGSAVSEEVGTGVLEAEIFDAATATWTTAAAATVERHYHSTALLLPDGRVWVAGSNPDRPLGSPPDPYNPTDECAGEPIGTPCHPNPHDGHGYDELRMEIYSPPYLFLGPRVEIASVPPVIRYGGQFDIRLATAADAARVERAVLMRPGATTHARDMNQRSVGIVTTTPQAGSDTIIATAPPDGGSAPPGHYMLFLLDGDGVPSVAPFVRLAESLSAVPITGQRLLLRDHSDPSRRRIIFRSNDPALGISGGAIDPMTDGVYLRVHNPATGESFCTGLPASGWTSGGSGVFRYRDISFVNGPCNRARLKNGRMLSLACRASAQPIGFSLDEAEQGQVAVTFRSGATSYCASFDGVNGADGSALALFHVRGAPAPVACAAPPSTCP